MEYKTTAEVAEKWGITRRRVSKLCSEGRVEGAVLKGHTWLIPDDAETPADARLKSGKYIKTKSEVTAHGNTD